MIWGVSFALHEQTVSDRRSDRIINANLAEYHVPVYADVPSLEALMIEEHDPRVNAPGIKGVGEIGVTGSAGAAANAVWHATGVRLRRFRSESTISLWLHPNQGGLQGGAPLQSLIGRCTAGEGSRPP